MTRLWLCLGVASGLVPSLHRHTAVERHAGLRRGVVLRSDRGQEVIAADDPLVKRVEAEVAAATGGKGLDSLLNPAKLLNIERDLVDLRSRVGQPGEDDAELFAMISKKEAVAYVEKRSVMRDWLKALFRGQAYATIGLGLVASNDAIPGVHLDLSLQVLGFWGWWLFTVPSLRSIKPLPAPEKKALDAAFLATLVASLAAPFATKDPAQIWWIDAGVVAACYGYGYLAPADTPGADDEEDVFDAKASGGAGALGQSLWRGAKFAYKALDVGSGIERGARSTEATALERTLESTLERKAAALIEADEADSVPEKADSVPEKK
ncbi:hypothetical protein M885DRAFT_520871 [Pelagophyceae sp. CCMP2097]|nr:hypothetical protein M885DRAFT_520871 [Pelagophyceae sp. CCMP2097]